MEEEIVFSLFWGLVFGTPIGWFLRSAAQWRREAKRIPAPVIQPVAISSPQPPPPTEARLERVLDRLSHRLETVEERIEFAERLLDTRSAGSHRPEAFDAKVTPLRDPTPQR
ncbi:MAG: hypothetical protein ACREMQ_09290 [Longimicrobiales bacterium]